MPRTVNEEDFNIKRNQILDSALKYIYTIGYDQMSIQNILNDLNISKGAFYHYFGSKEDLLIGIINRLGDSIYEQINPIVEDENLCAVEKLNNYFRKAGVLKMENIEILLPLMKVWYQDENMLVREKLTETSCRIIAPILTVIIRQGINEGAFANDYPDMIGEVIYRVFIDMGNSVADQMMIADADQFDVKKFTEHMQVYTRVVEKILGAQTGSLQIIPPDVMQKWLDIFLHSRKPAVKAEIPA